MAQIGGVTALALLVAGRTPAARLPHAPVPAGTARSVGELKFCIRDVSTGYGVRAVILLYPTQGVGPDRSGGRWVPPRTNPLVLQSDPQGRGGTNCRPEPTSSRCRRKAISRSGPIG